MNFGIRASEYNDWNSTLKLDAMAVVKFTDIIGGSIATLFGRNLFGWGSNHAIGAVWDVSDDPNLRIRPRLCQAMGGAVPSIIRAPLGEPNRTRGLGCARRACTMGSVAASPWSWTDTYVLCCQDHAVYNTLHWDVRLG